MSWFSAAILNIPLFLTIYFDKKADFCMEYWPKPDWLPKAYSSTWFFVAGVIPITIMTALYSRVVYSLWFKRGGSNPGNTQQVCIFNMTRAWDKKKRSESPTGMEPMTSRTPGGRSIHWATRISSVTFNYWAQNSPSSFTYHLSLLMMNSAVLILTLCRTPVPYKSVKMTWINLITELKIRHFQTLIRSDMR